MQDHKMGPQKCKYKIFHFFDFQLKGMVCFNLKTFEMIFGKHVGHIIKSAKQQFVIGTKLWAKTEAK